MMGRVGRVTVGRCKQPGELSYAGIRLDTAVGADLDWRAVAA